MGIVEKIDEKTYQATVLYAKKELDEYKKSRRTGELFEILYYFLRKEISRIVNYEVPYDPKNQYIYGGFCNLEDKICTLTIEFKIE